MPEASEINVTLPTVASEIQVLKAMAAIKASHDAWCSGMPVRPFTMFSCSWVQAISK